MEYKAIQAETLVIDKAIDSIELRFPKKCSVLMIEVRDKDGKLKDNVVNENTVEIPGKAKFAKGDIIKYIATF